VVFPYDNGDRAQISVEDREVLNLLLRGLELNEVQPAISLYEQYINGTGDMNYLADALVFQIRTVARATGQPFTEPSADFGKLLARWIKAYQDEAPATYAQRRWISALKKVLESKDRPEAQEQASASAQEGVVLTPEAVMEFATFVRRLAGHELPLHADYRLDDDLKAQWRAARESLHIHRPEFDGMYEELRRRILGKPRSPNEVVRLADELQREYVTQLAEDMKKALKEWHVRFEDAVRLKQWDKAEDILSTLEIYWTKLNGTDKRDLANAGVRLDQIKDSSTGEMTRAVNAWKNHLEEYIRNKNLKAAAKVIEDVRGYAAQLDRADRDGFMRDDIRLISAKGDVDRMVIRYQGALEAGRYEEADEILKTIETYILADDMAEWVAKARASLNEKPGYAVFKEAFWHTDGHLLAHSRQVQERWSMIYRNWRAIVQDTLKNPEDRLRFDLSVVKRLETFKVGEDAVIQWLMGRGYWQGDAQTGRLKSKVDMRQIRSALDQEWRHSGVATDKTDVITDGIMDILDHPRELMTFSQMRQILINRFSLPETPTWMVARINADFDVLKEVVDVRRQRVADAAMRASIHYLSSTETMRTFNESLITLKSLANGEKTVGPLARLSLLGVSAINYENKPEFEHALNAMAEVHQKYQSTNGFLAEMALGSLPIYTFKKLLDVVQQVRGREPGSKEEATAVEIVDAFLEFMGQRTKDRRFDADILDVDEKEFDEIVWTIESDLEIGNVTEQNLADFADQEFTKRYGQSLYAGNYSPLKGHVPVAAAVAFNAKVLLELIKFMSGRLKRPDLVGSVNYLGIHIKSLRAKDFITYEPLKEQSLQSGDMVEFHGDQFIVDQESNGHVFMAMVPSKLLVTGSEVHFVMIHREDLEEALFFRAENPVAAGRVDGAMISKERFNARLSALLSGKEENSVFLIAQKLSLLIPLYVGMSWAINSLEQDADSGYFESSSVVTEQKFSFKEGVGFKVGDRIDYDGQEGVVSEIRRHPSGFIFFKFDNGKIMIINPKVPMVDFKMIKQGSSNVGGIDMNAAHLRLQIKRDGRGVALPVAQQDLENIQLDGLVPVIISITPALKSSLLSLLQINS